MDDDPRLDVQLVTSFKETAPRTNGFFGKATQLSGEGNVAVLHSAAAQPFTDRFSLWQRDGGWTEEAVMEGTVQTALSRDGARLAFTVSADGGAVADFVRVLRHGSLGWQEEAVIPGIDQGVWTMSSDGTWLSTATGTETRLFVRDGGTWSESFVGPWSYSAISDDGTVLVNSTPYHFADGGVAVLNVYRYLAYQWTIETRLTPSGPWNGGAVWLSADGSTVMLPVAVHQTGTPQTNGEVYVFQRVNGVWSEQAVLHSDPGYVHAQFGIAGQLSSDGNRLVVSADAEQLADGGSLPNNGAVYLFSRRGSSWVRNRRLTSPAGLSGEFGHSVSLTSDGLQFLVGEPANSTGTGGVNGDLFAPAPHFSGAAFLYRVTGDGGS
jgi:hypothetical protein